MKWWARSNETDPGGQTGYYIGIYAMLGAVGMVSLIIGCRSVYSNHLNHRPYFMLIFGPIHSQMIISMVPKSGEKFHHQLLSRVLR